MTHEPECKVDIRPPELCWVCDALREREARVREDERGALYADPDRDPVAAYNRGYAAALRDAVHIVEQMLDEYPYDSEEYRAITTADNRLRISAGTEE